MLDIFVSFQSAVTKIYSDAESAAHLSDLLVAQKILMLFEQYLAISPIHESELRDHHQSACQLFCSDEEDGTLQAF